MMSGIKGGSMLVIFALLASCTRSPEVRRDRYMSVGKDFFQKKDYARAALEFKNASQAMPKDPEVYYQLGLAFLGAGDVRSAVLVLQKAVELNPKHSAAQIKLAQLAAYADDPEILKGAQERLKAILSVTPVNAAALQALAFTELKQGEQGDAVEHLMAAIAAAPQELSLAMNLSDVKLAQKDVKGAEEVLRKACEQSPKSPVAAVAMGRFYVNQKRPVDAEREFQRALTLDSKQSDALFSLATLQSAAGRKQEAEQSFTRLANFPDRLYKPVHAIFLFEEGRREEAIREFEKLAAEDPKDRAARTRLVSSYLQVNRVGDAERVLSEALKKNGNDLDALLQRAELLIASKKLEQADVDINRLFHMQPDSPEGHYVKAKLHQARGEDSIYRQELFKALQLSPYRLPIRLECAQTLIAFNDAKGAVALLDATPQSQKNMLPVVIQRLWALWALNDMVEMRKGLDAAFVSGKSLDLLVLDGLWKLRSGNAVGARASLEESLKINPADLRALAALRESYAIQKQPSVAMQKLKEYAAQTKSTAVQDYLGLLLLIEGDHAGARAAFMAAKAVDPQHVIKADFSLAQLDVAEHHLDEAATRLKVILKADPSNTTVRLWLGTIESVTGQNGPALENFRKVVEADPRNVQALNNFAFLLADFANKPDEALKHAEKAMELAPDSAEASDTLGWVYYKKGLYASAVTHLKRAASTEGNPVWKYHLAIAYAKTGELQLGRDTLKDALKRNPNLPEAKIAKEMLGVGQ